MSIGAVKAILSIYRGHSNLSLEVLEALGHAGGDKAIEAIVSINTSSHSNLRPQVLAALGKAGRNATK